MVKKHFGLLNPIKVHVEGNMVTIKRAARKVKLQLSDIKAVRAERRALRGHVLVVETNSSQAYFRQTQGHVNKAREYLQGLVQ